MFCLFFNKNIKEIHDKTKHNLLFLYARQQYSTTEFPRQNSTKQEQKFIVGDLPN